MKRIVILLAISSAPLLSQTTGAPLNLNLPAQGSNGWGDKLNQNFTNLNTAWSALPAFPTQNGIVYRASSTVLQPATAANVVALWNSCISGYLAFDGTCSTPTYSFAQITGTVGATQLPIFTSSAAGAVSASGGGTANFLRADGTWAAPPGGGGTYPAVGIANSTGSAWGTSYSASNQIPATFLPTFGTGAAGIVPASGGGTANYLRADGTWSAPPGGSGLSGLTNGYVPQATSSSTIGNSFIDYGVTNAGAYTSTKDIYAPGFHTTGAGTGGYEGLEGPAVSGVSTFDEMWADNVAHRWMMNNNAAGAVAVTGLIASGSTALGTSAIAAGACATVVTATATGVLTTDTVTWNPNASIKAVTGYIPGTGGGLSINAYPTANNVNFDVCNWSSGSITPGAVTLNWQVNR